MCLSVQHATVFFMFLHFIFDWLIGHYAPKIWGNGHCVYLCVLSSTFNGNPQIYGSILLLSEKHNELQYYMIFIYNDSFTMSIQVII